MTGTVTSSNPNVVAVTVPTGNKTLQLDVANFGTMKFQNSSGNPPMLQAAATTTSNGVTTVTKILPPNADQWWYLWHLLIVIGVSAVLFVFALMFFGRAEGDFAEELLELEQAGRPERGCRGRLRRLRLALTLGIFPGPDDLLDLPDRQVVGDGPPGQRLLEEAVG